MDGWIKIGTKLDTKDFDKQIEEVEYELEQVNYELSKKKELKLDDRTIREYQVKVEKLTNKIIDLKKKQEDLNNTNLRDVQKSIDNIGDGTSKTIKKVGKWALAVFGVRSAYMFVRSSIGILSQYNEQLATDIEYIKFTLASSLEPIITRLVQLVFQLLYYVNSLAKAWFNVDLFANASINGFRKANKSASELKKNLAGFDEMNVLNENGSVGALGTGTPSYDLSKMFDEDQVAEVENFWKKIDRFWTQDLQVMTNDIDGIWANFFKGLGMTGKGLYTTLKGIFDSIGGLLMMLVGVFTGNEELISKGWEKFCNGLKDIFLGLIETIAGLILTLLGFIQGLAIEVTGAIGNIITGFFDLIELGASGLSNFLEKLIYGLSSKGEFVLSTALTLIKGALDTVATLFGGLSKSVKQIFDGIIMIFKGEFKNGFISIGKGIANAFITVLNTVISAINAVWTSLLNIVDSVGSLFGKEWNLRTRLSIPKIPYLATGGIVNMPGRGVPVGSAIAGESGAEGVIPLTDSQAMETLGQAIGRYITINASITNTMNGRVISKELKRINNDSDFAFNR